MNSNTESLDNFFKTNESRVNTFFSKVVFTVVPVYPALICLTLNHYLPDTELFRLIFLFVMSVSMSIIFFVATRKNPSASYNKMVLFIFANCLMFLISIEQGFQVSLIYVLPPLYASLYFDDRFTLHTFNITFIFLVLSYIIRAFTTFDAYQPFSSRLYWGLLRGLGAASEFIIFGTISYLISKEMKKLITDVFNHRQNVRQIQEQIIIGFSNIIESKEGVNARNITHMTEFVKLICYKLKDKNLHSDFMTDSNISMMSMAVPFHDIGKVSIPDKLLNKTEKLAAEEFEAIKNHPLIGANFINEKLAVLNDPQFIQIAHDMALYHHERFDGTGYPFKLKGDSIPLCARVMCAADILDALLSKRAYKDAYSVNKSLLIMKELSGKSIDPEIAAVLISSRDEINYVLKGGSFSHANE